MATLGFEDYIKPLKVYLAKYRELKQGDNKGSNKGGEGTMRKDVPGIHGGCAGYSWWISSWSQHPRVGSSRLFRATHELYATSDHLMSQRWFTHASPTMFNAGTPRPQLSSCFLVCMEDDSIEGIYDTLKECAVISKSAGGIGVSIHNIRVTSSYIRGTN